jgi:hypothetical protein
MSALLKSVAELSPGQRAILERRLKEKRASSVTARIPRHGREGNSFVTSFAQQRLWFLQRLEPDSNAYNIPNALHTKGPLNLEALEQSIDEIRRRHEVLRTIFAVREGQPVQIVGPAQPEDLPVVDLSGVSQPDRDRLTKELVEAEANRPFNLSSETSLRSSVLKLKEDEHIILFTMHHIASDSWSMDVLVNEVGTLYQAFSKGRPSPLPVLPIQYADFAVWQREWLQGQELEKQQNYWKQQLSGMRPLLELPVDRPRPAKETHHGAIHSVALSKELSTNLQTMSRKQGATLFMTLLAGFKLLLSYLTNHDDIVVGTDVANRGRVETENLIGFFVNQLVLRTQISGDSTFEGLLRRVRDVTLEAYANQDLPFERVVEIINPNRTATHAPLFQVKLILNHAPSSGLTLPQLDLKLLNAERTTAQLDIAFPLWETSEGIGGWLNYNTDLFDGATMDRFGRLFEKLLDAVVANPLATVNELKAMLADQNRREQVERELQFAQSSQFRLRQARRKAVVHSA